MFLIYCKKKVYNHINLQEFFNLDRGLQPLGAFWFRLIFIFFIFVCYSTLQPL